MARLTQPALWVLAPLLFLFAPVSTAQTYKVIDLGPASGAGRAINVLGEVDADNGTLAFAWSAGKRIGGFQARLSNREKSSREASS